MEAGALKPDDCAKPHCEILTGCVCRQVVGGVINCCRPSGVCVDLFVGCDRSMTAVRVAGGGCHAGCDGSGMFRIQLELISTQWSWLRAALNFLQQDWPSTGKPDQAVPTDVDVLLAPRHCCKEFKAGVGL